ncbi:MAG TPA: hypothetical protein VKS21_10780, partial [Spirochaetota bacterium]|nr:hypothetical protein [Spirochaetota bacterium]
MVIFNGHKYSISPAYDKEVQRWGALFFKRIYLSFFQTFSFSRIILILITSRSRQVCRSVLVP